MRTDTSESRSNKTKTRKVRRPSIIDEHSVRRKEHSFIFAAVFFSPATFIIQKPADQTTRKEPRGEDSRKILIIYRRRGRKRRFAKAPVDDLYSIADRSTYFRHFRSVGNSRIWNMSEIDMAEARWNDYGVIIWRACGMVFFYEQFCTVAINLLIWNWNI